MENILTFPIDKKVDHLTEEFKGIYQRPAESRKIFEEKGWRTIAALQLRNPMHRSHEYLAKIAVELFESNWQKADDLYGVYCNIV